MTDNGNKEKAPLKLQLTRTVESGKVQQTFSRGRTKAVTVEVKKTRTFSRQGGGTLTETTASTTPAKAEGQKDYIPPSSPAAAHLTESERQARLRVLEEAANRPKTEEALDEVDSEEFIEEEIVHEVSAEPVAEIEQAVPVAADAPVKAESPAAAVAEKPKFGGLKIIDHGDADEERPAHADKKKKVTAAVVEEKEKVVPGKLKAGERDKRRQGKLTITNAAFFDQEERMRSLASIKRRREKAKRQSFEGDENQKSIREVVLPEKITVQELSNRLAVRSQEVIRELMKLGMMSKTSDEIDADTAELVVTELGHKFKRVTDADIENILVQAEARAEDILPRPPVVTIMGHVDHGKTSLLDALREANVVAGEAGGITQHIGAYQVKTEGGETITFLDTPGHAAFTAMRKRGAHVTDIVILVVAADDGIMPQTIEAISHAKAAEVPIIVAINKIDKPEADIDRVKNELLSHELVPEDYGGDTMIVPISAKQRINLDKLLEAILLQAEVLELKASANMRAEGTVIEAQVDKNRGVAVTVLVQKGTLRTGDIIIAGKATGRVKTITNDRGMQLSEALPAQPVEVLGFIELPLAGDNFIVAETDKQVRDVADYRRKVERDLKAFELASSTESVLDRMLRKGKDGGKELRVIIKGDVQGSVEAIAGSLEKLANSEVKVKVIHQAAGSITDSDVQLASATGAQIVGFNVRATATAKQLAGEEKVDVRYYSIIYNLIDDMKAVVGGLMAPVKREDLIGYATIQQVFKMSKFGKVAGCKVTEGVVKRGAGVRLLRDNVVIHEGKLKTLKRFKDDMAEVKEGYECGIQFENYEDIKEGDVIECYEIIMEAPVLA